MGRPATAAALEQLIVRLARENANWGNGKIQGELLKLGYDVSDQTVATLLRRHDIPPVPERSPSPSWRRLRTHYRDQILACDFFRVETLLLQTIYVLFFIEVSTQRVYLVGCTTHHHSQRVLREYVLYSNQARPHQGLGQQIPFPRLVPPEDGPVRCRAVLGGILHDYYRQAA